MDRAPSRRAHHQAARLRLRRTVLVGLAIVQSVAGVLGILLALLDAGKDPAIATVFVSDIVAAIVVLWLVYARRHLDRAIVVYCGYLGLNYALFALHASGVNVFVTPWALIPPICGFYLGGRRLGVVMTATIVAEAICAFVVRALGVGHHFIDIPPIEDPAMLAMLAVSAAEILFIVGAFEWARAREESELGRALAALDEQAETVTSLVENVTDPILLLDGEQRVVTRNAAAAQAFPRLARGVSLLDAAPAARVGAWERWFADAAASGHVQAEETLETAAGPRSYECSCARVAAGGRLVGYTLVARDLTRRREAEAALRRMRGQLLDASRRAGMAEVATALLHEAGNSLNGAQVSVSRLREGAGALKVDGVRRAAGLLRERAAELAAVLPVKGAQLIDFMDALADHLEAQRRALAHEAGELDEQITRVAVTLAAQSARTRAPEVYEEIDPVELVTSALAADDAAGREVQLDALPPIVSVRSKLSQIVVSLLAHASRAGRVTLRATPGGGVELLLPHAGAAARDLFSHGGPLHAAALGATELGGSLATHDAALVLALPPCAPRAA